MSAMRLGSIPRRSTVARSSRFCTSTDERWRPSSGRNAKVKRRGTRTLAVSLMNIVPSPVIALRHTTGRPIAASDPDDGGRQRDVMGEIGLEAVSVVIFGPSYSRFPLIPVSDLSWRLIFQHRYTPGDRSFFYNNYMSPHRMFQPYHQGIR